MDGDEAADVAIAVTPRRSRPFQPANPAAIGAIELVAFMTHRFAAAHNLTVHGAPLFGQPWHDIID